jgi:predicted HD superfamily hydrolase involved in NAD metabolism
MNPEILEQVQDYVRQRLSSGRLAHTIRVVGTVQTIAKRHNLDMDECSLAAWLHDAAKEEPRAAFEGLLRNRQILLDAETISQPKLWHAFHAGYLGRVIFGIESDEVYDAVCYHPTGAPGLGKVGLALFVADYSEPGRSMRDTGDILSMAEKNLYEASFRVAEEKIRYLVGKGREVHSRAMAFHSWVLKQLNGAEKPEWH